MRYTFRVLVLSLVATVCLNTAFVCAAGQAGTATPKKAATKKRPPTIQEQLQQVNNQLKQQQDQIQQQQSQIQQLQQTNTQLQSQVQQQGQALQSSVQDANQKAAAAQDGVNSLHTTVTDLQSSTQATANSLLETKKSVTTLENPLAIHYKGITILPGGFLESTLYVRARNENADNASTFGSIPFNGVTNAKLSEFRMSARSSRVALTAIGMAGSTKLTGYYEADFLGAAPTANYVETNAFTPRQRQLWIQAEFKSGVSLLVGQYWNLMVTNRKGISPTALFIPNTIEASYVVGYTYIRQNSIRVTKNFNNKIWAAAEIGNPETTFAASFTPPNIMGFNTSANALTPTVFTLPFLSGYSQGLSTNTAPDIIGKLVFEPSWGHFEFKGLLRTFRDRLGTNNNVTAGGGFGWGMIIPATKKADIIFEGLVGSGIGRYGAANQTDVTVRPDGTLVPLQALHSLAGIELHPTPKVDVFFYGGDEYVGKARYTTTNAEGVVVPAGYGSFLVNNTYCNVEVVPTGKPACGAQNKNVADGTVGFWWRIYKGPYGTFQYGDQYEYIWRNTWSGIGGAPTGNDNIVYSAFRYILP